MPEYGRHIQQMVDYCLTLESRDERNACAKTIVDTICRLNPSLRTNPEWRAKLWDHLAIMSNFQLDIDYPSEPVNPEELNCRPEKVAIPQHRISKRVYGANILKMIDAACAIDEENPEREELVLLLANHMKKLLVAENPEVATNARICADLAQLSEGRIRLNPETVQLREFEILEPVGQSKKKRRRR